MIFCKFLIYLKHYIKLIYKEILIMKEDFIKKLSSMSNKEISNYIKQKGKEAKKIKLAIFLK